jgi:signal transduction histidine kinase
MASIGKLTQGLIDRILNPMNYITNFSKLSQGLVKDIKASIEDNKEAMNADDYEDTADALDMLTKNLQTVDDHGQSTTRTLKAMEELLKEHSGGRSDIDLLPILRLNEQVFRNNHASEIGTYGIKVSFSLPATPMMVCGNADQLSKAVMNLLTNAIYAVVKKSQRQHYDAAVLLTATESDGLYKVKVHDNGIGIEATILDKVFDPFFTTKTTGEASGTGLYLSREIVQNHGGDITVESVKDKYSEFTITLPVLKEKQ